MNHYLKSDLDNEYWVDEREKKKRDREWAERRSM